jgi:homoserine kinase
MRTTAFAPATVANLAAGFDLLGAAVQPVDGGLWGDEVEVADAVRDDFAVVGPLALGVPHGADNLCLRAADLLRHRLGTLPPLRLTLRKGLPLASGVGSSSASVVATLVALNQHLGLPLGADDLLALAGQAEGSAAGAPHLDNVAPCLLGGLQLIADGRPRRLPWPDRWALVIASPDLQLTTRTARAVLPAQVSLGVAVAHAGHVAGLVHALHTDDPALLAASLRDVLAEPARATLVPGFREAQSAAMACGALGCSLSGAGPAVFAAAEWADAAAVADALRRGFAAVGVSAVARICRLDPHGARVLPWN